MSSAYLPGGHIAAGLGATPNESMLQAVMESLPVPIVWTDTDILVRGWNAAAERYFGWSATDVLGHPFPAVPDDRWDEYESLLKQVLRGESITPIETIRLTPEGREVQVAVSAAPVRDESGQIVGAVAVFEDFAARNRAAALGLERERLLVKSEEQRNHHFDLLMQAPISIAVARGPKHVYEFANERYLRVYGNRDIIGKPAADVVPEAISQGLVAIADRVYASGEPFYGSEEPFEFDFDGDGTPELHYFNVVMQPIHDADGAITGLMLLSVDVTDQVEARRAVERLAAAQSELSRHKDDFLAAAAHDLKTPLTTIKGFTQILQRRAGRSSLPEMSAMTEELERIDITTGKMTALINELLDVTRIEMGRPLQLLRRRIDLVELAREVVADRQSSAPRHVIELSAAGDALVGLWDGHRLERSIGNVIANAIKYSPEGGRVAVRVRSGGIETEPYGVIEVQDWGIGIPPADLPRIFERFYRASNVDPTMPGTGVGLTAVRKVIEEHGGWIEVSTREGAGTTVTIGLPVNPEVRLEPTSDPEAAR